MTRPFYIVFYNNIFYSNSLDNVIITQTHIVWSNYLIRIKCGPIQSHVFGCSQIHDTFVHVSRMCSITHYKCVVDIVLRIFFTPYVLLCSKIMQCGLVCYNSNTILQFWRGNKLPPLLCRNAIAASSPWGSFSLCFNISCIKCTIT